MKTYVLDTNVLLHDPNSLYVFQENKVIIPLAVIEEIDDQKRRVDEVGRNARQVSRQLDTLRQSGSLAEGVPNPKGGGSIRVELNHSAASPDFPKVLDPKKTDNRILSVAWNLKQSLSEPVVLVTKDLNLRVKADVLGIQTDDFRNDKVDFQSLYSGVREMSLPHEQIDLFYQIGLVQPGGLETARPHEFFVLKGENSPSLSALSRHQDGALHPLIYANLDCMGIRPRNKEQRFALELLLNDSVQVVTLAGGAGTGKTLLALAAGLEKVLEQKAYNKLLVTRPIVPMGNDLGYLPGEKEDKLRPWMQPIYDNLEYLFREHPSTGGVKGDKPFGTQEYLLAQGLLEIEALTYIRGRSIPNQFIICDEAQNLTPHMVKTLITRAGESTKIVFTGDPEQIDHPYLDSSSNGLTYLVEKLKGEAISGHITLTRGERSEVAELGARLL